MSKPVSSRIGFCVSLIAAFFVQHLVVNAQQATKKQVGEKEKVEAKTKVASPNARFLRIRRDQKGRPVAMETSVVRYQMKNKDGETVIVDLIGAVHVGEKEYYKSLNKQFEKYESLLYELVAPEGTVIPKGGRVDDGSISLNPVGGIQKGLKNLLDLEFQLEKIDYTKDNFVHADMTPTEFGESMSENEESIGGYALKAMGQSMAMQASGKDTGTAGMIMALFSSDKSLRMRRVMAQQMIDMEAGLAMFEGKNGSTIINHRNAKCMEVLKRELAAGKKKIAIFYGAGHLLDMEKRLISDFQMNAGGQKWLPAWTLTKRKYER
jgi:hypothetical protein